MQNDNCWPKESNMKDWKFQIKVTIVTYTISQWFATCLTAPIFSACALSLHTISNKLASFNLPWNIVFERTLNYFLNQKIPYCCTTIQSSINQRWHQIVLREKKWHPRCSSMSLIFLSHFETFCSLLLKICTAKWNLFVSFNKRYKSFFMVTSPMHLCSNRSQVENNQSTQYIIQLII